MKIDVTESRGERKVFLNNLIIRSITVSEKHSFSAALGGSHHGQVGIVLDDVRGDAVPMARLPCFRYSSATSVNVVSR